MLCLCVCVCVCVCARDGTAGTRTFDNNRGHSQGKRMKTEQLYSTASNPDLLHNLHDISTKITSYLLSTFSLFFCSYRLPHFLLDTCSLSLPRCSQLSSVMRVRMTPVALWGTFQRCEALFWSVLEPSGGNSQLPVLLGASL